MITFEIVLAFVRRFWKPLIGAVVVLGLVGFGMYVSNLRHERDDLRVRLDEIQAIADRAIENRVRCSAALAEQTASVERLAEESRTLSNRLRVAHDEAVAIADARAERDRLARETVRLREIVAEMTPCETYETALVAIAEGIDR